MYPFFLVGDPIPSGSVDLFLAVGGSGGATTDPAWVTTSTDGTTWSAQGPSILLSPAVDTLNGAWAVAYSSVAGFFYIGAGQQHVTTVDGTTLNFHRSSTVTIWGVGVGNGGFLAAASLNRWFRSADGITWVGAISWPAPASVLEDVYEFGYSATLDQWAAASNRGRVWVASGTDPFTLGSAAWTAPLTGVAALRSVEWCPGIDLWCVAGTNGAIYHSPDGAVWTLAVTRPVGISLEGIAWNGTLAVVVGQGGAIWTSPDLVTWTARTSFTATQLWDVTWSQALGLFAACGDDGVMGTSPDGITWSAQASGVPAGQPLRGITCRTVLT